MNTRGHLIQFPSHLSRAATSSFPEEPAVRSRGILIGYPMELAGVSTAPVECLDEPASVVPFGAEILHFIDSLAQQGEEG